MNLEDQFGLEHLLFEQRKCKICGEMKELINDFYKTRKDFTVQMISQIGLKTIDQMIGDREIDSTFKIIR